MPPVVASYADTWQLDRAKVDLIKRTICPPDTDDDELALYLHECQRRGVHPMDRLVVMTKRNDRHTGRDRVVFMTTIDYKRSRAEETGAYAGNDDPEMGPTMRHEGREVPTWARCTVYKLVNGQRCPFTARVYWREYYPGRGERSFMWDKMPLNQLGKCAESKALSKAFPQKLGNLPIEEELDRNVDEEPTPTARRASPAATAQPRPEFVDARSADVTFEPDVEFDDDEQLHDEGDGETWSVSQLKRGRQPRTKKPMWELTATNAVGGSITAYTTDAEVAAALKLLHEQERSFAMEWEQRDNYDAILSVTPL